MVRRCARADARWGAHEQVDSRAVPAGSHEAEEAVDMNLCRVGFGPCRCNELAYPKARSVLRFLLNFW